MINTIPTYRSEAVVQSIYWLPLLPVNLVLSKYKRIFAKQHCTEEILCRRFTVCHLLCMTYQAFCFIRSLRERVGAYCIRPEMSLKIDGKFYLWLENPSWLRELVLWSSIACLCCCYGNECMRLSIKAKANVVLGKWRRFYFPSPPH